MRAAGAVGSTARSGGQATPRVIARATCIPRASSSAEHGRPRAQPAAHATTSAVASRSTPREVRRAAPRLRRAAPRRGCRREQNQESHGGEVRHVGRSHGGAHQGRKESDARAGHVVARATGGASMAWRTALHCCAAGRRLRVLSGDGPRVRSEGDEEC